MINRDIVGACAVVLAAAFGMAQAEAAVSAADARALRQEYNALLAVRTRAVKSLLKGKASRGPGKLSELITDEECGKDPAGAIHKMAVHASYAYQDVRAADLSARYSDLPFSKAMQMAALSVPDWCVRKALLGAEGTKTTLAALDEEDGLEGLDAIEETPPDSGALKMDSMPEIKRPSFPKQYDAMTDADVHAIRAYIARLKHLIEVRLTATGPQDEFVVWSEEMTDPFFGPYFTGVPLATDANGVARLSAEAGRAGTQLWQHFPVWHTVGPFVGDRKQDYTTPLLPEIVPALSASYLPNIDRLGESYERPKDGCIRWFEQRTYNRFVAPPGHRLRMHLPKLKEGESYAARTVGVHGATRTRWYGVARVIADRDVQLYASAGANGRGKLWLNDRLVWMSGRAPRWSGRGVIEQRHPVVFKVALRKGMNEFLFECRCTRSLSHFSLLLCTRGRPMSVEKRAAFRKAQLAARQKMPPDPRRGGRGGNFTSGAYPEADPPLWWDVKKGINVLWRTPMPDYSAGTPVIAGDRVFVNCEPHTLYCLDKNTGKILWKRDSNILEFVPDEKTRAAAIESWDAARRKKKSPEEEKLEEELAKQERALSDLRDSGKATEGKVAQLEQRIEGLKKKLESVAGASGTHKGWLAKLGVRSPGWSNNYGWTFGSPTTDGKHVWVKFATGVAACYDLEGNREWMVRTHMSGGVPQLPSPFVMEGNVIIPGQFSEEKQGELYEKVPDALPDLPFTVLALDAETGKRVWARPVSGIGGYGGQAGCCPVILTNGKRKKEVIATSTGTILDPKDGRVLCNPLGLGITCWHEAPFSVENRVYWQRSGYIRAAELWLEDNGQVGGKVVVISDYGIRWASASYVDGYVVWSRPGLPRGRKTRVPAPIHSFEQVDMRTGKGMPPIESVLDAGGLGYTPAASAGPYAVVCGTGPGPMAWAINRNSSAQIAFVKPGPTPSTVGSADLGEPMVAAPIFEGKRMYVRTYQSVMCISAGTAEGRKLMLSRKAQQIFKLIPAKPRAYGVWEIAPVAGFKPPAGVAVTRFGAETTPEEWVQPVPDKFEAGGGLDVAGLIRGAGSGASWFCSILYSSSERLLRVKLEGDPDSKVWFAGQWIRNNNTIRIQRGYYPLLARARPAAGKPSVKVSFTESEAYRKWKPLLKEFRGRLEEIVREMPGTPEAEKAQSMIAAADEL